MFEYIQKKIKEQESSTGVSSTPNISDTEDLTIVECAHLIQELDDLSLEGQDEYRIRPLEIDIPLENDLEVETVEFNMMDGRITDIPMDATVQEYEISDRSRMKTYQNFYQEASMYIQQMPRESYDKYQQRVSYYAQKHYDKYCNYVIQEGLFGFDKIDLNDDRVPINIMCNFGPIKEGGKDYIVKLLVKFEIDKKRQINKKQLDAIHMFQSLEASACVAEPMMQLLKKDFANEMSKVKNVWDIATPKCLYVMNDQANKYKVSIEFELDFSDEPYYMTWSHDVKSVKKKAEKKDISFIQHRIMSNKSFKSKKEYVKESYEMNRPSRFPTRFFQEEIDFGAGDPNTELPPAMDTGNPSVSMDDTGSDSNNTPTQTDGSTNQQQSDSSPDNVNNVSDQIAEKIQDDTAAENNNGDMNDVSMDGDTANVDSDMGTNDSDVSAELDSLDDSSTSGDMSVDDQLNDLDGDTGDDGLGDSSVDGSIDVENMTIDELLEQGADKLKGMTVQQLKNFLSGDQSAIQEAFILTKKNINGEVEVHLRTALGILNDDQMSIDELLDKFQKESKKLNRVLSKAAKMNKLYSEEERAAFNRLNKCLADLTITLKASKDANYTATIKRLIQAFTSEAAGVSQIIESKKGNKPIGESYTDSTDDEYFQEFVAEISLGTFIAGCVIQSAILLIPTFYRIHKIRASYKDIFKYTNEVLTNIKNNDPVKKLKKTLTKLQKAIQWALRATTTTSDEAKTLKDLDRCTSDIIAVLAKLKANKKDSRKFPEQLNTYFERFMILSVDILKICTGDFDDEMADKVLAELKKINKEGKVENDAE